MPDSVETLKATEELVKLGFVVLPYCQADPTLCKRLEEAGAATVMPLGAPIGTNKGLQTRDFLRIIIEQANIPVVVDAGIGAPSHAAEAMEMGASACLVNTAIAVAGDPVTMAVAFKQAVEAGRMAYEAGLGIQADNFVAEASSPLTAFLNEKVTKQGDLRLDNLRFTIEVTHAIINLPVERGCLTIQTPIVNCLIVNLYITKPKEK